MFRVKPIGEREGKKWGEERGEGKWGGGREVLMFREVLMLNRLAEGRGEVGGVVRGEVGGGGGGGGKWGEERGKGGRGGRGGSEGRK